MPKYGTSGSAAARAWQLKRKRSIWNPLDKSAIIDLTGGNLVATNNTATTFGAARATNGRAGGKYQFDVLVNSGAFNNAIGVANLTAALAGALGGDNNSVGYFPTVGVFVGGVQVLTPGTWLAGDTIGIAVDMIGKLLYVRVNAGAWSTGVDISAIAGTLYPAISVYDLGNQFTLLPAPTSLKAGFGAWG